SQRVLIGRSSSTWWIALIGSTMRWPNRFARKAFRSSWTRFSRAASSARFLSVRSVTMRAILCFSPDRARRSRASGVGTQQPEHVRIIVHGSRPEMLGSRGLGLHSTIWELHWGNSSNKGRGLLHLALIHAHECRLR